MYILKNINTQHGVTAAYHKILRIEIYPPRNIISVMVGMYFSEEAMLDPKSAPLWSETLDFTIDDVNSDVLNKVYAKLLTTELFSGGTLASNQ